MAIVLRSLLFNAYFFGSLIAMLLVMWLLLPLPRTAMQGAVRLWARGLDGAMRLMVSLRTEVRGRHHLTDGPLLVASKHQSTWDTAVFYLLLGDPAYVLKKELLSIPLWGWYARKSRSIAVDRAGGGAALKKMVRECLDALEAGRQVIIFPEGTRTAPGHSLPYHPGVYALYAASPVPVVPVALNSGLFWGRRNFIKRPGVITVEVLPPIPQGLPRRAFMERLASDIETASRRLADEGETAPPSAAA